MAGNHNESEPVVTREVYFHCCAEIQEWIDVTAMQGQLMRHGILATADDLHSITHGSPGEKRNYVFQKVCKMKNGFSLLYRCLRESQDIQMGHKDAADVLEERARQVAAATPSLHNPSISSSNSLPPSSSNSLPPPPSASLPPPPSTTPTASSSTATCSTSCLTPGMFSTPTEEQRDEDGEGEGGVVAQARLSDLIKAQDFETLYQYSLQKTDFDLEITSLRHEEELLNHIVRFIVAILNSRHRSRACLPGILIAGITYTVYPDPTDSMATDTKGEVVMTTLEEQYFEETLQERVSRDVRCHGSNRLLSDEELGCVKVEFVPVGDHGNSVLTLYVCPTWEICKSNLYCCWDQSQVVCSEGEGAGERVGGVEYWVRGDMGCGQLLFKQVQEQASKLLVAWQQQQELGPS